jgi:NAD(P)-dependent dehydrogenase (short-subunit alcohol dehydrogenase family)
MSELTGKVAVVTGASRGIGKAIALTFAREGARVVICGRKLETLEPVAAEAEGEVIPVVCHVGRSEDIERLAARAGRVDILVNNAGTNIAQGPALTFTDAQFDKMVDVNLKSAFRLIQRFAPAMCDRGDGSIINIASVAGIKPQFESLLYSMTKAALIMMTQSYALELGRRGVRVNAIAPGLIQTTLSEYYWKDEDRRGEFMKRQPIPRIGQPQEIADVALMLAAGRSSYLTGQTIVVDGGVTLC